MKWKCSSCEYTWAIIFSSSKMDFPATKQVSSFMQLRNYFNFLSKRTERKKNNARTFVDIGRDYKDKEGVLPHFELTKSKPLPWTKVAAHFRVFNGKDYLDEVIYYSHLTLLKMCKHYQFETVLDIGSHERKCTRVFEHIGKKVTTIEIEPQYEADYKCDYLAHKFDQPFDAIWCSQTYEHQRNPGIFLDKIFDELKEGGVLGLTIPVQIDSHLNFGHINLTSPLMLMYHLVCAGFDCKNIALKVYNGNIGVILKKKYNGIKRGLAMGSLPLLGSMDTGTKGLREEIFGNMQSCFPFPITKTFITHQYNSINWGDPI